MDILISSEQLPSTALDSVNDGNPAPHLETLDYFVQEPSDYLNHNPSKASIRDTTALPSECVVCDKTVVESAEKIHGNGIVGNHEFEIDEPGTTSKYATSKQITTQSGGVIILNGIDGSTGEEEMTNKRQRRSRWDRPVDSDGQSGDAVAIKKRKSRWADEEPKPLIQLPDFMGGIEFDPEIQQLNSRLLEISRILQSGMPLDSRPEGTRSPSPEPLYDNMGIRINTREYRAREKLNRDRQEIISQIIKRNPSFRPPSDYRPPKLYRKLNIPKKEYPGYNFIGLIIGPRGNTQKRMEKETGAKIVIRGKGSIKEGRLQQKRDWKPDPSDNEELHVLVEADTQESLDAAAGMVEKILQPVDEVLNEHKRLQLRELASLNGTIRDEEFCRLCGEAGHRQYACPSRSTTFKSDVLCKNCGDGGHPTIDCPLKGSMKGSSGTVMDDEYKSFLAELGGSLPESATKPTTFAILASGTAARLADGAGNTSHPGLGFMKEFDETNLYIGYLPPTIDDDGLIRLFSPFGDIVMTKVIKDRVTGMSKGYGFVKYADIQQANSAICKMNGHILEGRTIAVRVAGKPPPPALPPGPPVSSMATYPPVGSSVLTYPSQQFYTNAPSGNYMGAHVPWGPPVHPPYPPQPPGLSTFTGFQNAPVVTYGAQYPDCTSTRVVSSSEESQTFPPGMKPESSVSGQYGNPYINGNSMASMSPSIHSSFPSASFGYPSYFVPSPPPPHVPYPASVDHSQVMVNAPWNSKPLPPLSVTPAEKPAFVTDAEYEKFMAEMK